MACLVMPDEGLVIFDKGRWIFWFDLAVKPKWRSCHGDAVRNVSILLKIYADCSYEGSLFRAAVKSAIARQPVTNLPERN